MKKYEYMTVDLSAEPSFNVHIKLERYIEKLNGIRKTGLAFDFRNGRLEVFHL